MNIWLVMLIAGALTFLTRLSFIWMFGRMAVPPLVKRALDLVPPAVLSVIIFQELLIRDSRLALGLDNTRLLAGIVAVFVAWRTRSSLLTIAAGMAALYILNAIL
jgi:branched-subunit amino acid transport protein